MISLIFSFVALASTSDIAFVLNELGRGVFQVREIVPGGMCPGHFDLSVEDALSIQNGDILFYHGWEGWISKVEKMEKHPELILLSTKGNWMIPQVLRKGVEEMASVLLNRVKDNRKRQKILKNRDGLIALIKDTDREVKKISLPLKGKRVICNEFVKEQMEYLGMEVISTFPSAEMFTPVEIAGIVKKKGVDIIVDNQQSIGKAGRVIAREMNLPLVVISNFPLKDDYKCTLLENVKRILEALKNDQDRKPAR